MIDRPAQQVVSWTAYGLLKGILGEALDLARWVIFASMMMTREDGR